MINYPVGGGFGQRGCSVAGGGGEKKEKKKVRRSGPSMVKIYGLVVLNYSTENVVLNVM